jgi:hypothetical protein
MKVGDKVVHVDRLDLIGRVVAKQSKALGTGIVLVLWEKSLRNPDAIPMVNGRRTSRHHWSTLTKVLSNEVAR